MSTTIPATQTDLITRMAALNDEIAQLTGLLNDLKAQARRDLPADTYTYNGSPVLRITPNRRFNLQKGVSMLSTEQMQACLVTNYDVAKVRAQLAPALQELCMDEVGEPKVVLL